MGAGNCGVDGIKQDFDCGHNWELDVPLDEDRRRIRAVTAPTAL